MGESRQELLAWVNSLLQLNITKVEQMGQGAALCQIYDSIFGDVQMSRVNFSAAAEYSYIANFKILQNAFTKHQVERTVPIQALTKCKMQDNLEFLQWTKRFWDQYYPGGEYDAESRRPAGGAGKLGGGTAKGLAPRAGSSAARRTPTTGAAPRLGGARAGAAPRVGMTAGGGAASAALKQENEQLKETVQGLERERDFYFSKLRDIELLIQQAIDENPELEKDDGLLKSIQEILYSTEEGFEIPAETEGEEVAGEDLETF